MEIQERIKSSKRNYTNKGDKYGVTERKKSELDALQIKMTNQQFLVEQSQAVVDSLSTKLTKFQAYLVTADSNKTKALANRELLQEIIKNARNLVQGSRVCKKQVVEAHDQNKEVASSTTQLINELIYAADVINKLANLVTRQKALNPLISDELVAMIATAGTDANNAVALTLTALKSSYTTQASLDENEAIAVLEFIKAEELLKNITTNDSDSETSLKDSINQAYKEAKSQYNLALDASNDTTKQLEDSKAQLEKQKVALASTQAELAAATAAALA